MTNWDAFLRNTCVQEIDFGRFIEELKKTNAVFLHDFHSESAPHSRNQQKILEALIKVSDVNLGLEYSGETKVAHYHRSLIEMSKRAEKDLFFITLPNAREIIEEKGYWHFYRENEKHMFEKIREIITKGKKIVTVLGEDHLRPGEKNSCGIPFLLNGNSVVGIVYQDLLENTPAGIYKLDKDIPGKIIYNINKELD